VLPPLDEVQNALADQRLDGWLLTDFDGRNPIAVDALGLSVSPPRGRFFVWLPVTGAPCVVHHPRDRAAFAGLAWPKRPVTSARDLEDTLRDLLPVGARVALEYAAGGRAPALNRVDAGTVDQLRGLGLELVSSAHLVQWLLCRWDEAQLESHRRAAMRLEVTKEAAFHHIGERLRAGRPAFEHEVEALMRGHFAEHGLVSSEGPTVAVGRHTADPDHQASADDPTPIERGQLVRIDLSGKETAARAAFAAVTWMAFTGRDPPSEVRQAWDALRTAREAGLEHLRARHAAGERVLGCEVDRSIREVVAAQMPEARCPRRSGHNLGSAALEGAGAALDDVETHDTRPLVVGTCFTLGPGLYLPDHGLRSTVSVFLASTGPQVFTPSQRTLRMLG
jgi:Xaa-Pro aminopeptidase